MVRKYLAYLWIVKTVSFRIFLTRSEIRHERWVMYVWSFFIQKFIKHFKQFRIHQGLCKQDLTLYSSYLCLLDNLYQKRDLSNQFKLEGYQPYFLPSSTLGPYLHFFAVHCQTLNIFIQLFYLRVHFSWKLKISFFSSRNCRNQSFFDF